MRILFTLAALGGLASPRVAWAQGAREWRLTSFDAQIEVFQSGDVLVTETLMPHFDGQFNGIYRSIPVEYRTPRGFREKLRLNVEAVEDDAGHELRYDVSREGAYKKIKIWVPGARDATRTVVLKYRVPNALRFFDADEERDGIGKAYDELYWNVTGTEWPVPIDRASATVRLPAGAAGIRAHAFTGAYGSTTEGAEVRTEGTRVHFETDTLGFREGLTIGVAWDAGIIERPGAADKAAFFLSANWPLVLPFVFFIVMYRRWRDRGRDPEIGSIEPRYEPPESLTPAEVGVVIDNRADMRDVTATVVDLAVRGYLTIEEVEDKVLGLFTSKDYVFRKVRSSEEWNTLESHERKLLDAFFGAADQVELSDLKNKFYTHLPDIKKDLLDTLVEHGIYPRRPDVVAGIYVGIGIGVGAVIAAVGTTMGEAVFHLSPLAVIIGAVGSALAIIGFGVVMPARTKQGTKVFRHVKGFEEFLDRVESDRFKRMIKGPEQFEAFLPFAMALGVESQWARAFEGLYSEPPDWYRGSSFHAFNPTVFVSDLGRMSTQAQSVMQSAPRSSGGSSFSGGGGFSGGGFGGGGGGAF